MEYNWKLGSLGSRVRFVFFKRERDFLMKAKAERVRFFIKRTRDNLWWDYHQGFLRILEDPRYGRLEKFLHVNDLRKELREELNREDRFDIPGSLDLNPKPVEVNLRLKDVRDPKERAELIQRMRSKALANQGSENGKREESHPLPKTGYLGSWATLLFFISSNRRLRALRSSEVDFIASEIKDLEPSRAREQILNGHELYLSWEGDRRFLVSKRNLLESELRKITRWESKNWLAHERLISERKSPSYKIWDLSSGPIMAAMMISYLKQNPFFFIICSLWLFRKLQQDFGIKPFLNKMDHVFKDKRLSKIWITDSLKIDFVDLGTKDRLKRGGERILKNKASLKAQSIYLCLLFVSCLSVRKLLEQTVLPQNTISLLPLLCWFLINLVFRIDLLIRIISNRDQKVLESRGFLVYPIERIRSLILSSKKKERIIDPCQVVRLRKRRTFLKIILSFTAIFLSSMMVELWALDNSLSIYRHMNDDVSYLMRSASDAELLGEDSLANRKANLGFSKLMSNLIRNLSDFYLYNQDPASISGRWIFKEAVCKSFNVLMDFIDLYFLQTNPVPTKVEDFKFFIQRLKLFVPLSSLAIAWNAVFQRYSFFHNSNPERLQRQVDWLNKNYEEANSMLNLWTNKQRLQRTMDLENFLGEKRLNCLTPLTEKNKKFQHYTKAEEEMEEWRRENDLARKEILTYGASVGQSKTVMTKKRDSRSVKGARDLWDKYLLKGKKDKLNNLGSHELDQSFWSFNGRRLNLIFKLVGIIYLSKVISICLDQNAMEILYQQALESRENMSWDHLKEVSKSRFFQLDQELSKDIKEMSQISSKDDK